MQLPTPDEVGARQFLARNNWPVGLQELFVNGCVQLPIRFIIVDDSGSMATNDGKRLLPSGKKLKELPCSRWSELCESLKFHAELAESARAPTEFRLLNNSDSIMVGCKNDNGQGYRVLLSLLDQSPNGGTPLCRHINEVVQKICILEPQLRANRQRAVLVIATDGESSDGDVAQAMKPLRSLPVWVVIRLCTGEERIVNYWNNIDKDLEVNMDIIDDFLSESQDIRRVNGWFTYGEPLHRLREFGIVMKDLDLIDESKLSADQMRNVVAMLTIGGPSSEFPNPLSHWKDFARFTNDATNSQPVTWCPVDKVQRKWIRMDVLEREYRQGGGGCCVV